jgi:hypothetical protein
LEHLLAQLPSDVRAQVATLLGQRMQPDQASEPFLNRSEPAERSVLSTENMEETVPPKQ